MKFRKTKILIKVTAFLLMFSFVFSIVQNLLVSRSSIDMQFIPPFYEEREDSLDAVYIGSSNCYAFWNSAFAFKNYGICVYPYSSNGQPFYAAEYLIKEAGKTQKDAVYVVNINTVFDDTVPFDHFHNLINVMPNSLNKLQMINHLRYMGGYSLEDSWEYYFPIVRFHSRWNEVNSDDLKTQLSKLKGATATPLYLKNVVDVTKQYVTSDKIGELPEKVIESTNSLLDYCDKEKIKVVFVTVPQAVNEKARIERYNALNKLIEDRGYDVLYLQDKIDEMGINLEVDYYNGEHTNIHGSIKFTNYLSEYLIEKYGFKDKRGDKDYKDWQTALEEYQEISKRRIMPFELDTDHRDYNLGISAVSLKKNENAVEVSWDEISGADGYAVFRKYGSGGEWKEISTVKTLRFTDDTVKINSDYFYYYTVAPFTEKDGVRYYGDCYYRGESIKP